MTTTTRLPPLPSPDLATVVGATERAAGGLYERLHAMTTPATPATFAALDLSELTEAARLVALSVLEIAHVADRDPRTRSPRPRRSRRRATGYADAAYVRVLVVALRHGDVAPDDPEVAALRRRLGGAITPDRVDTLARALGANISNLARRAVPRTPSAPAY